MRVQIHESLDDDIREEAHRRKLRPGVVVTDIVRHALAGGPDFSPVYKSGSADPPEVTA